ncbi:MAG TPA: flagellar hook-associated protein FlgL [Candidatus Binatia bacterium]|jgi:flagellar hook-associated protein 3 FlgL
MRVTSQMLGIQVNDGLQRAYQRLARAQEVVSSGRRINHLADDPINATRAMDLRGFENSVAQYTRNIDNTMPFLEQADSAFDDVVQGMTRARELTVQIANDIYSPVERRAVGREVRQIFEHLLSVANTEVDNRFLFGGFINAAAPFTETSIGVNYLGDNGDIRVQTNATSTLSINFSGSQVFQAAGVPGGQGIFDTLRDLEALLNGQSAPNALSLAVNLDGAVAPGAGFSPVDAVGTEAPAAPFLGEADFFTTVTVFDSKGTGHELTFLFAKTSATTYNYRVAANSAEITGGTPGNLYQVALQGTLAFNAGGTLNAGASTLNPITLTGFTNGAADITIAAADMSFAGSTQLAQPSAVLTLNQTNVGGYATQLGRIDAAIDQMLTFRAEAGARLNMAQQVNDALEVLRTRTLGERSRIEDADVLTAYSDFTRLQNAFDAALQSASQVLRPSLLDFLR